MKETAAGGIRATQGTFSSFYFMRDISAWDTSAHLYNNGFLVHNKN